MDLTPSRQRLEALIPQVERYVGEVKRGLVWDRLLREYYAERVFVDIAVARVAVWPDLNASGDMQVTGAAWPGPGRPAAAAARSGTGPRMDVAKAAGQIAAQAAPRAGLPRGGRVPGGGAGADRRA